MKRISYTQFSMYMDCPHKWYLSYIKDLRSREDSIHTMFGTSIHCTLQEYLSVMYNKSVKDAEELDLHKFFEDKFVEIFKSYKENFNKLICDQNTFIEFYQDGINIIDFFKKNRVDYFSKNDHELMGIELPLDYDLNKVEWNGFIDVAIKNKKTNKVKIIDFKTSTRGWTDYQKSSQSKTAQLVLYKQFYAKKYDFPIENIDIEFIILKRKLYENSDFPQKRIQRFTPSSGSVTVKRVLVKLKEFIDNSFLDNGEYNTTGHYLKNASTNNCRFCDYKDKPELCNKINQ